MLLRAPAGAAPAGAPGCALAAQIAAQGQVSAAGAECFAAAGPSQADNEQDIAGSEEAEAAKQAVAEVEGQLQQS